MMPVVHRWMGRPWMAVLVVAALVSACGGRRGPAPFGESERERAITVEVDNGNYLDVVVYVLQGRSTARVGTVSGLTTTSLPVAGQLVALGRIRVMVDPIGSPGGYVTEEIPVNPGDVVVVRVGSELRQSSWFIR